MCEKMPSALGGYYTGEAKEVRTSLKEKIEKTKYITEAKSRKVKRVEELLAKYPFAEELFELLNLMQDF